MLVPTILNIDFRLITDSILDTFLPVILTYTFSFHNVSTIKDIFFTFDLCVPRDYQCLRPPLVARSGSRHYQGIARDWEEDIMKMPIPIHKMNIMKNAF